MFINYLILALSASIDSLGIGITYGFRNTKISFASKIILFIISVIITYLSLLFGNIINNILPNNITMLFAGLLLIIMGIWIIYQAINKVDSNYDKCTKVEPKIYNFFIKFLGITIQIIRNPISSDLDNSKKIDWKEALYLGIALSIDSVCIGICSSIIGYSSIILPFLVALFQLLFLLFGNVLGKKVSSISKIPENIWNVFSGVLLICIGVSRFIK